MAFRETSTMVSDIALASCCYIAGTLRFYRLPQPTWRNTFLSWFAMIGFSSIGFAAVLGAFRFGNFFPKKYHSMKAWHIYFSHVASLIGLPMLAAAYTQRTEWQNLCWFFVVLSFFCLLLHCIDVIHIAVRDFSAALAVIFIIFSSVFMEFSNRINRYGLLGSCSLIVAIAVSDQGRGIFGMKNVDIFHYILCLGVCLYAEGLIY